MSNKWGIDLTGRKMWYNPWAVDEKGKYIQPNEKEIEEIYGISGEAVAETLLYFEECSDKLKIENTKKLINLLNNHIIDNRFKITREELLDKSRWYNCEYYFYFIMFTKKIMNNYNWRFTKGEDVQLSKYHKIYEIGFLRYIPYGGKEKDDSYSMPNAMIKCYIKKGYDFSDFFNWMENLVKQKTSISYKNVVSKLDNFWVCSEFTEFLYELGKVIINKSNMVTIAKESFEHFDLVGFSYVPESLLLKIQSFIGNKTTNFYNIKTKSIKNNSAAFYISISEKFDKKKDDIYTAADYEMASAITLAAFPGMIKRLLKLNKDPEVTNLYFMDKEKYSFTIKWEKRILSIPYLQLFIFNSFTTVLYILNNLLNWKIFPVISVFFLLVNTILIILRKLKIEIYKKNIAEEHIIKIIEDNEKRLEKSVELSNELIIEKQILEKKVKERTHNLEKAKEKIEENNIKLKELDKLKNDFIANVTHELRTPLSLILSPVESIIAGDYGNNIFHSDEKLKMILYNGSKLLKLINNLLDFAKIDAGMMSVKKQYINVSKLLNFYVSTVKSSAENKGLSIIYNDNNTEGNLITYIDRDLFEKTIFNLISNSLKFTPYGGHIIVQLDERENDFIISIKDNGIGIPEDKLETIFERFQQIDSSASRKYEGTGIGLALTKELVEILGGKISVKSKINQGTSFTIILPYLRAERCLEKETENIYYVRSYFQPDLQITYDTSKDFNYKIEQIDKTNNNKNKKILIVEDNPDMQKYIKSILEKEYIVILAQNGREGLQVTDVEKPDLILADVMMPDMDGYEMIKKIKINLELKNIPIILLTAKADMVMKLEGFKIGANDYIIKPFNAKELSARIKIQLEMKALRDKLLNQKIELQKALEDKISTQKSLEQKEKRLSEMIEHLPVAIIEEDLNNKIIYMNQYAKNLLKIKSIGLLNEIKLVDYINDHDKFEFINRTKNLNRENNIDLNEYKLMLKTGEKLTVIIKSVPYYKFNNLMGVRYTIIEIQPNFNLTLLPNNNFYNKYKITKREKEILIYLLQGYRNKDIGEELFLSEAGIKKHISNMYTKTNVKNRSELLKLITRNTQYNSN